jgi:hypothetical protein
MGTRYSRIRQGAKLEAARLAKQAYENAAATRPSRIGQGQARDLDAVVYVAPFTVHVAADEVVSAKAYNDGFTTLGALINASSVAEVATALGANSVVNIPKFRPARIVWFRNTVRSITTPRSAVTNMEYLKYAGDSFSCPFGATADADDMIDSFLDVKTRILAVGGYAISRVSLTREKVGIEPA